MVRDALKETEGGTLIRVEVMPGASRVEFGYNEWRRAVEVRVRSHAKEGAANRELLKLFSKIFGYAELMRGDRSRSKIIFVPKPVDEVAEILESLIG